MSTERTIAAPTDETEARPGLGTRAFALSALVLTGGSLLWLVVAIVRVFTDSWIAPLALTPENDAVLTMNLELTRQRADIDRVQAEIARFDASLAAIDGGLERLRGLRDRSDEIFAYGADTLGAEAGVLSQAVVDLREERGILDRLIERQRSETERAREHLAAGLIERRELEHQEQTLDGLELQRVENQRAIAQAQHLRSRAHESAGQFRASADGDMQASMPEIVLRHESEAHLEVEILRLEAERRGVATARDIAVESVARLRAVMDQIETRPIYLATREPMDVAFVPYEQLEGVTAGAPIFQCTAGIFFCHDVGRVRSILPGEVVTQDPWGELARGRYAVLDLDDDTAVQERILRVR
jgi:hypothetical protein